MFPSSSLATLRPDLSGSFMEFDLEKNMQGMIGAQVFPVLNVGKPQGNFGKVPIESLLRSIETHRAPGGAYNRDKWTFTPASYTCEEHGVEQPVDDREAEMYRDYFDAEQISALRARNMVVSGHEDRVEALVFDASGDVNDTAGTNWSAPGTGVPVTDVEAAVQRLYAKGILANALVLPWKAFRNCRNTDQVRDRIASSGAGDRVSQGLITLQQLAQVFDLRHIIVAGGMKNTANEGAAASISSHWTETQALVCRIAETDDIREPCIGRTFHYSEDGSEVGGTVESYRDETVRSNIIRVRMDTDEQLLYPEAGEIITGLAG